MKKIAVLLGIAALASGAWAEQWTFQFTLENYDKHSLQNTSVYLVDTSSDKVIAYTMQSEYGSESSTTPEGIEWSQSGTSSHNDDTVVIGGKKYTNAKIATWKGSLSMSNLKDDTMTLAFNFLGSASDDNVIFGVDPNKSGDYTSDNLAFILYDGTEGVNKQYTITPVGVTAARSATAKVDFKNIPEPTSGLLMLFGMAGLALKRKRAA